MLRVDRSCPCLGQDRKPLTEMPEISDTLENQAQASLKRLKALEPDAVDLLDVLCLQYQTSIGCDMCPVSIFSDCGSGSFLIGFVLTDSWMCPLPVCMEQ